MALAYRPEVFTLDNGFKYYTYECETHFMKVYVPTATIDGSVINYTFRAPLLTVLEEKNQSVEEAVKFAEESGLAKIAAENDAVVVFLYPTCEGGWANATVDLFKDFIANVKMDPSYEDGIVDCVDFRNNEFVGYFVRGALFRANVYSYGASADYAAKYLLNTIDGMYLWGPGDITPAVVSMERLSVVPEVTRKDIAVISVNNSDEINEVIEEYDYSLTIDKADYYSDFKDFGWEYKRWCGELLLEPNFEEIGLVEDPGKVTVKTSPENYSKNKGTEEHEIGYFAYYNKNAFDNGPIPLILAFHGGGDSTMYLTYVSAWYELCHRYGFLYVPVENHTFEMAEDIIQIIDHLKAKYDIDESRIYATGFSMGSGKTWDMLMQYPEKFAGFMPLSALFPMDNPYSPKLGDKINMTIPKPIFYSGGELSFLPELPCHADTCLGRIKYLSKVNKLKKQFTYSYDEKDKWEDPVWSVPGDKIEKIHDDERDADLTVHYFESEDGVVRTALASVSNQQHECRQHSCEEAWKFISQFVNESGCEK